MKTRKRSDQKSTSSRRSSASESTSVNQNICELCKCQIQKLAKSDEVAAVKIKLSNLEKQIDDSLNTRNITAVEEYVKSTLHEHSLNTTNLTQKVNVLNEQLKSLESCLKEIKANCVPAVVTSETNNMKESSFTHKPGGNVVIKPLQQMESNPTSMFDAYCTDFITNPLRDELAKFLTEKKFLPKKAEV